MPATDISKKNEVVNQIAETLSKIDKAEDFTKLQEYIRQCSKLLHIDETGLTTLVNKYKRDAVTKSEKRLPFENVEPSALPAALVQDQIDLIVNGDDLQERSVLRVLLEFGLGSWDETRTIAQYIYSRTGRI